MSNMAEKTTLKAENGKRPRLHAAGMPKLPSSGRAPMVTHEARDRMMLWFLGVLTAIGIFLCYRLAVPFLPALTWAIALAVVARPMHVMIARRLRNRTFAAVASVALVSVIVVLPLVFAGQQLAQETMLLVDRLKTDGGESVWKSLKAHAGIFAPVLDLIDRQASMSAQMESFAKWAVEGTKLIWSASVGVVLGGLITMFFLFYFFRDRQKLLGSLRGILPLAPAETTRVLKRIDDTIHAMVFGSLGVALIQGALGGIMFWFLGLPSPLVWAAVMCVCAILPIFGAALVWVPAALYLWTTGDTDRALVMVGWGAIVISLIDNLLYPVLVRDRMRLHTVPVFVAIVGGIAVFGAAGLVLGPVVLAVTLALLGIWRDRMRSA
jgi:predicted PurR-regulated permease PerM